MKRSTRPSPSTGAAASPARPVPAAGLRLVDLRPGLALLLPLLAVLLAVAAATPLAAFEEPPVSIRDNTPLHVAFTRATVYVSPDRRIENATLVVEDGRVTAVGSGLPVPAGATEIDLAGATVYPGFVDPFTDYGIRDSGSAGGGDGEWDWRDLPPFESERPGLASWNDAIHTHRDWVDHFQPDAEAAGKLLERGVTSVFSVRQDGILRGRGFVAALGDGAAAEEVVRPLALHAGSFDKGSSAQAYPSSLMGSIALLRQTFLDLEWYRAVAEARGEASRTPNRSLDALDAYDGPILFETDDDLDLLRAGRVSEEAGVPFIHVGSNFEYARVDEIAALGQPIILPLDWPDPPAVISAEDELDVTLAELRHWERSPSNPAVLAERGVAFAFTGHRLEDGGEFLPRLRRAVARGLPVRTALAALTTVPAELTGVAGQVGSLEPGHRADLVVASGDLFGGEAEIRSVWVGGEPAWEKVPTGAPDLRGTYRLDHGGTTWTLEIGGDDLDDVDVELTASGSEETISGEEVETLRDRVSFVAALPGADADADADADAPKARTRFTLLRFGPLADGELVARMVGPDGRRESAPVERLTARSGADDGDDERDEDDDRGFDLDRAPLVSRLTHPNVAWGYGSVPEAETVLVRGATIWTSGPDGVLEDADLLVRDGAIVAVGPGLDAPRGARVIDGTGLHVTPGLIDEHSHLAVSGGVNEATHASTAEVRIGDAIDPEDIGIYRALAGGTTAAQLLHGSANPIGGQSAIVKLRWGQGAEELKIDGAPPAIKFALGENVKQSNWGDEYTQRYPQSRMGVEAMMRDRFTAAREYGDAWRSWRALPPGTRDRAAPPRRDLELEALLEVLEGERLPHVHSYVQSEILMLMRLAEDLGFRIHTFTHILEGYKVAPEMAAHGAMASTFSDWWAYKFEVYDAIPYNTCLMVDAGVVTSVNSDSGELIRRLNQEAAKSVLYCDMDEATALELVTINPARQLAIDDRVGSLEPGKDADFVLWTGNPLSMTSRVVQTWVDGALLFDRERDEAERRALADEKAALVQRVLAADDGGGGGGGGGDWGDWAAGWSTRKGTERWHCEDRVDVWALDRSGHGSAGHGSTGHGEERR